MAVHLHPRSPRGLFLAAHHATWAGAYFQRVLLAAQLVDHPDAAVGRYRDGLFRALREEGPQVVPFLKLAHALALGMELDVPAPPSLPPQWEPWSSALLAGYAEELDLEQMESAPFTFGWEVGRLRATLATLVTVMELHRVGLDQRHRLTAGVRDLSESFTRSPGAAFQLARHGWAGPVVDLWRPAHTALGHLARADAANLDPEGLRQLDQGARDLLELLAGIELEAAAVMPGKP